VGVEMGRRVRLRWQESATPASQVVVRSLSEPKPGWTLEQALDMVEQGYSLDRVSDVTGFQVAHLRAAARAAGLPVDA
jgi:hypothetical protein